MDCGAFPPRAYAKPDERGIYQATRFRFSFYIDHALPPEAQAIRVETAGFSSGAHVFANDILQGSINYAGVFALPLRRGSWRITVEDENGSGTTEIEVR
jgi:penicillin-binding protein 1C